MNATPTLNGPHSTPTQIRRLPSGLTILVRENHDVHVATADVWVRTGAADEPRELAGVSHFLEHMLFKGTERFRTGEIEREIENVGGVCNAGTSYDFTHYYLTMPTENIGRGIEMLAEMMGHSALDPIELEKERLVIIEEYRRKQDNPGAMLYEELYEQLFETGPYHLPVIGTMETIQSITRDQMFDYYRRHYAPQNMALVVTGDVNIEAVMCKAEKVFNGLSHRYEPLVPVPAPTRVARAKRHHLERPTGGEVYLALACGAPGAEEIDQIIPLDVAQFILGQGRGSILYQEIKERKRLCSTISCYYSTQRSQSLFMVAVTCPAGGESEASRAIRQRLDQFASEPIAPEQLHRARRLLASGHLFSFETTGAASSEIGYYYTLTGGTEFMDTYLERLGAVTEEQVQEAFRAMRAEYELIEVSVGPTTAPEEELEGAPGMPPASAEIR